MQTFSIGDEVVIKEGDKLLICLICDRYQNKEGQFILHLVEPETKTQFRRLEAVFMKDKKTLPPLSPDGPG